jgi:hypothetical protein
LGGTQPFLHEGLSENIYIPMSERYLYIIFGIGNISELTSGLPLLKKTMGSLTGPDNGSGEMLN